MSIFIHAALIVNIIVTIKYKSQGMSRSDGRLAWEAKSLLQLGTLRAHILVYYIMSKTPFDNYYF